VAGPLAPLVLVFWVAAAALACLYLPGLGSESGSLADNVPRNAPAVATEERSARIFGQPLSRVAVVQHDPDGLEPGVQRHAVATAVRATQHPLGPLLGALPIVNDPRLWPGGQGRTTTAVTYLYFRPGAAWPDQVRAAGRYAAGLGRHPEPRSSA
jgi:RND superfamily putative drug exporter